MPHKDLACIADRRCNLAICAPCNALIRSAIQSRAADCKLRNCATIGKTLRRGSGTCTVRHTLSVFVFPPLQQAYVFLRGGHRDHEDPRPHLYRSDVRRLQWPTSSGVPTSPSVHAKVALGDTAVSSRAMSLLLGDTVPRRKQLLEPDLKYKAPPPSLVMVFPLKPQSLNVMVLP
jgi:hypothetical protein